MAQGQLVYSQLGPVNTTGNPQLDQVRAYGAPSVDSNGSVAYRRFSVDGRSTYLANGVFISPAIIASLNPSSPDYAVMDQSFRSPLFTSGMVYAASRDLGGPYVYRSVNGVIETALRPNLPVDTSTGTVVTTVNGSLGQLAGQGTSLVASVMTRTPNDPTALYRPSLVRIDGTQPTLIASLGSTIAPGTNQTFALNSSVSVLTPSMDPSGRVIFAADLANTNLASSFSSGIWAHSTSGGLTPLHLARTNTNDPRPTGPASVNAQGDIVFRTIAHNVYTRSNATGQIQLVNTRSALPPLAGATVHNTLINNSGEVLTVLNTTLGGPNLGRLNALVLTSPTGDPRIIAQSDHQLPGFIDHSIGLLPPPAASTFSGANEQLFSPRLGYTASFAEIAFNNLGQAAFFVHCESATNPNNLALLAYDPRGGLVTLALVGRPLPASLPSLTSTATVTEINFIGNTNTTSGYATGLNDRGLVAFRASFNDGSSRLITVQLPTPGALTTLALASLLATRRRRAR